MNAESTPAQAPQPKQEWSTPSLEINRVDALTHAWLEVGNDGLGALTAEIS